MDSHQKSWTERQKLKAGHEKHGALLTDHQVDSINGSLGGLYKLASLLAGIIGVIVGWAWAWGEWGSLLGFFLGWAPGLVLGLIVALTWPLIVLFILYSWL